jgi:hypothetical protein
MSEDELRIIVRSEKRSKMRSKSFYFDQIPLNIEHTTLNNIFARAERRHIVSLCSKILKSDSRFSLKNGCCIVRVNFHRQAPQ